MKLRTKKLIREVAADFVFTAIIAALAYFLVTTAINKKCASECGDCSATFDWCPGYWEDKNICQGGK